MNGKKVEALDRNAFTVFDRYLKPWRFSTAPFFFTVQIPPPVKQKRRQKPTMNDNHTNPYRLGRRPGQQDLRPLPSNHIVKNKGRLKNGKRVQDFATNNKPLQPFLKLIIPFQILLLIRFFLISKPFFQGLYHLVSLFWYSYNSLSVLISLISPLSGSVVSSVNWWGAILFVTCQF